MTAAPSRPSAADPARPDGVTPDGAPGHAGDPSTDPRFDTVIHRRPTRSVRVGDIWIGSNHPVVVQS